MVVAGFVMPAVLASAVGSGAGALHSSRQQWTARMLVTSLL